MYHTYNFSINYLITEWNTMYFYSLFCKISFYKVRCIVVIGLILLNLKKTYLIIFLTI